MYADECCDVNRDNDNNNNNNYDTDNESKSPLIGWVMNDFCLSIISTDICIKFLLHMEKNNSNNKNNYSIE